MTASTKSYDPIRIYPADEALRLRGEGRWDLLEGRIVEMGQDWTGDEHGAVESNVGAALHSYARAKRSGKVRVGEVGIYIRRNPDTVRGADVIYISNERYAQKLSASALDVAPELIVEVLSPNDKQDEVREKIRDYFSIGVRLVWIADPKARSVFAHRSLTEVREFTSTDEITAEDVLPGFKAKVSLFFEE
jgi:Uma2 family endonuclease